jgi:hypothetical protein
MNKPRLDFSPDEAAFRAMNAHDLVWRWDQHAFPVDEVQAEMRAQDALGFGDVCVTIRQKIVAARFTVEK